LEAVAKSKPVLGVALSHGDVLLAISAPGHGSTSQVFHVVEFVKPLIYRNGTPPAAAHRF
jgi:D-arabinose 5-phosphate isomerase GutQ